LLIILPIYLWAYFCYVTQPLAGISIDAREIQHFKH
ncbi:unnamed protein product, partial [Bemisia tabaci]